MVNRCDLAFQLINIRMLAFMTADTFSNGQVSGITWCLLFGSPIITIYPENQTIHHKQS